MMRVFRPFGFLIFLLMSGCNDTLQPPSLKPVLSKEQIIETYLKNGAWNHHYLSKEFEFWVDSGIAQDSTIAYLWQQKTLSLWKQHKYDLAEKYYNKAVALHPEKWMSRLGYLQCIFAKRYTQALQTLDTYIRTFGSTYEQDHSLEFFKALCHLQLENYDMAVQLLQEDIIAQETTHGPDWVHYLSYFYLGVAYYEQSAYTLALDAFEKAINDYPQFSDAYYYISHSYAEIGATEKAQQYWQDGQLYYHQNFTFNEDASIYVLFPYQVTWEWDYYKSSVR